MEHDRSVLVDQTLEHCQELLEISSCATQDQSDSFSSLNDSLPCPRPGVIIERSSSSPTDFIVTKKEMSQASSVEKDNFRQVDLDELDPIYVNALGLKLNLILPVYNQWKKQYHIEDHEQSNLITFIKQLKDEEISIYFTDVILQEAEKWNDEHGYGIVDLIRYSIMERLTNNREFPGTPFDTVHTNKWMPQVYQSVRDGELVYMRHLQIYSVDGDLFGSKERYLRNSLTIFKEKSVDEEIFFYHGTTENHAQSIVSRGIHLVSRGSRAGDFGFGFYTTNNFISALRHAEHRAKKAGNEHRPACLVFCMSKNEFDGHQIIRLAYDAKQDEGREKMDENSLDNKDIFQWDIFVYKCLNNDAPLPLIHNKDAIIGPITTNLTDITLGYRPNKRKGSPVPMQTAIISMKLAYVLLDGLKGVIIWRTKM